MVAGSLRGRVAEGGCEGRRGCCCCVPHVQICCEDWARRVKQFSVTRLGFDEIAVLLRINLSSPTNFQPRA